MAETEPDRRTRCLMCGGRCDPDKWTCHNCNLWLMAEACHELIDQAVAEARQEGAA